MCILLQRGQNPVPIFKLGGTPLLLIVGKACCLKQMNFKHMYAHDQVNDEYVHVWHCTVFVGLV